MKLMVSVWHWTGIDIVRKALKIPCYQIAVNAGVDASEIVNKVSSLSGDMGYDALNGKFVNMIESGILDPAKVSIPVWPTTLWQLKHWQLWRIKCCIKINIWNRVEVKIIIKNIYIKNWTPYWNLHQQRAAHVFVKGCHL